MVSRVPEDVLRARSATVGRMAAAPSNNEKGEIDPSFVITHTMSLDDAPKGYEIFQKKQDECIKIVLKPWANGLLEHDAKNGA